MNILADEIYKTHISYFANVCDKQCERIITIRDWITNYQMYFRDKVLECRALYYYYLQVDEKDKQRFKQEYQQRKVTYLGASTPSCIFYKERKTTSKDKLFTGIITIDIDNYTGDLEELKHKVINLPYCFATGKSVSGYGIWAMIAYNKDNDFLGTWLSLKDKFDEMGIEIDEACKDFTRTRFISYDDNTLIKSLKSEIEIYDDFKIVKPKKQEKTNNEVINIVEGDLKLLSDCIEYLINEQRYGTNDCKLYDKYDYKQWFDDGRLLSSLNDKAIGLELFIKISRQDTNFKSEDDVKSKFEKFDKYGDEQSCVAYYFGLCKKCLGTNWRNLVSNDKQNRFKNTKNKKTIKSYETKKVIKKGFTI